MLKHLIGEIQTNFKEILNNSFLDEVNEKIEKEYELFEGEIPIYPPKHLIFNAFQHFNIEDTKVVLIGQDPYINEGQAMGLCFSVPNGTKMPPSLRNIFKELENEFGKKRENTDLTGWVKQGVILINASLTVLQGKSNSHAKIWRDYTNEVLRLLSERNPNIIYILWGNFAIQKSKYIKNGTIVKGVHPSPLSASRGFFGNNHFTIVNDKLEKPIQWI